MFEMGVKCEMGGWDTSWITVKVYSEAKSRFPADNGVVVGALARSEKYMRRWQSLRALLNSVENEAQGTESPLRVDRVLCVEN